MPAFVLHDSDSNAFSYFPGDVLLLYLYTVNHCPKTPQRYLSPGVYLAIVANILLSALPDIAL